MLDPFHLFTGFQDNEVVSCHHLKVINFFNAINSWI